MLTQLDEPVADEHPLSKHECEKLSQMVSNGVASQQGVQQVEDVVFQAAPDLSSNQVSRFFSSSLKNQLGPGPVL